VSVTAINTTLTAGAEEVNYQWVNCNDLFSVIEDSTAQSFAPDVSGQYAVIISDNGCRDTSACFEVVVPCLINPAVVQNNHTLTATMEDVSYQWLTCDDNDAAIEGATLRTFTPTANGQFAVILTKNTCRDTSACIEVIVTGVETSEQEHAVLLYPNPATETCRVVLPAAYTQADAQLLNALGEVVLTTTLSGEDTLNVASLPAGIYFLLLETAQHVHTVQLVVQ
jgi:hypothetical protein